MQRHCWTCSAAAGWASADIFDEDEEQCHVTNLDEEAEVVSDLWRFVKAEGEDDEEDDGFGPKEVDPKKKKRRVEEKVTFFFWRGGWGVCQP